MLDFVNQHIDKMLQMFTQGDYFETLKKAKEKYMSLTGKLDEDQSEFESRMNCFNDWYIFQYKNENGGKFVEEYLNKIQATEDISQSFLSVNHSLYIYKRVNMKKQIVLSDLLHENDIVLTKDHKSLSLVEDDMFMGRILTYKGENVLLRGVCLLPNSIKSSLMKEAKKIKRENSLEAEIKFLLHLESLVTKSMNYHHIDPAKIFVFS